MKAEIISIGDELLIGQTINTNASWMGQECSLHGIHVVQVTTITDQEEHILQAVEEAFERADLVLVTGGLGPTKDDVTKYTLCKFFNTELEIHIPTLQHVEAFFTRYNRPMLEANIRQAELPKSCEVLPNKNGTAAGMWFDYKGKVLVSMPGVPYEMKGIMLDEVFPRLTSRFSLKALYHKTLLTTGIGESFLAEKIESWENKLRNSGLSLAYLPSPGMVKLRITSYEGKERADEIDALFQELWEELPEYVYGWGSERLSAVVGDLLRKSNKTIGSVESCTGGMLAGALVSVAGSSDYFQGSLLTYSNTLKQKLADVTKESLDQFGAVSREVVEQMAENGRKRLGVDYCMATSGIAGPDGGTADKPVGTVWIAVASADRVFARKFQFGGNRERNIQMSVQAALNMLRCIHLKII